MGLLSFIGNKLLAIVLFVVAFVCVVSSFPYAGTAPFFILGFIALIAFLAGIYYLMKP
jgi:membrane-bound ClpP family serine protease